MRIKIVLPMLLIASALFSAQLTRTQEKNLEMCVKITKEMGNDPKTICPIMLVESQGILNENTVVGDRFLKPFDRSYGIMQMRFRTVKEIIKKLKLKEYYSIPDEYLLAKLMLSPKFGIIMANHYFNYLKKFKKYKYPISYIISYNSGHYDSKNIVYRKRYEKMLKVYNEWLKKKEKRGNDESLDVR